MKKYLGEEFLNRIYKDLVNTDIVKYSGIGRNKNEDVSIYMDRLDRITLKSIKQEHLSVLKNLYYDKYIIKPNDVPDAYFELKKRIALERGYGHIEYDDYMRKIEIDRIIEEQKESIDSWIDYFSYNNTFPTWFKYYCFQGMIKLGYYDVRSKKFTKRTKSTVKPFVELNKDAISFLYDNLIKVLNHKEIDDKDLERLLRGGSFSKIYSYIISKINSINKINNNSNDGIWKKYNQGSDASLLFDDIHGRGTGWCTADTVRVAKKQLDKGDFYIYFTSDNEGYFTNPRLAIRMEHGKIAEIRGVDSNQNLEIEMHDVLNCKLEEFFDRDEYMKKVDNMQLLTSIYRKFKNNKFITKSDLRFIYEIDDEILGFGLCKDPRIQEIIEQRNVKRDLSIIFDCEPENISFTNEEALSGDIAFHYGFLYLPIESIKQLKLPEYVSGNIFLSDLLTVDRLILPKIVKGTLLLNKLKSVEYLKLPTFAKKINISSLEDFNTIIIPDELDCELICPLVDNDINILRERCREGRIKHKSLVKNK